MSRSIWELFEASFAECCNTQYLERTQNLSEGQLVMHSSCFKLRRDWTQMPAPIVLTKVDDSPQTHWKFWKPAPCQFLERIRMNELCSLPGPIALRERQSHEHLMAVSMVQYFQSPRHHGSPVHSPCPPHPRPKLGPENGEEISDLSVWRDGQDLISPRKAKEKSQGEGIPWMKAQSRGLWAMWKMWETKHSKGACSQFF